MRTQLSSGAGLRALLCAGLVASGSSARPTPAPALAWAPAATVGGGSSLLAGRGGAGAKPPRPAPTYGRRGVRVGHSQWAATRRHTGRGPSPPRGGGMHQSHDFASEPDKVLGSFDLEGVAEYIKAGKANNIVVMVGAGMSVSSGIPDFRTPGSGLYDNLAKYDLPYPEAIFDLDYFRTKPGAFNLLAKELYPGNFKPTPAHYFLTLLHSKGMLRRCFTQNIDSLEHQADLPKEKIVAAHGNFDQASCIDCGALADAEDVRATLEASGEPRCTKCGGLVKPNIVFFGEALPERFFSLSHEDLPQCDLLIIMGTSLQVYPFAGLVGQVGRRTPRLLINRELVGVADPFAAPYGGGGALEFGPANTRDAAFLGDCDDGVRQLVELLGWKEEFEALLRNKTGTGAPTDL